MSLKNSRSGFESQGFHHNAPVAQRQSRELLTPRSRFQNPPGTPKGKKMKLDPEETIPLTAEDIERINEICANPPLTEYMLEAARRYRERFKNDKDSY